VNKYIE